jgi:hypothetical protein
MKKNLLLSFLFICIISSSCKKGSGNAGVNYGSDLNTWTFKEGSTVFSGQLLFDAASLNKTLQSNNSYTFDMSGPEKNSGALFSLILSLLDLNFTVKTYQSGTSGNDYLNAFYYTETPSSVDDIYKSSNLDPGPIMNYTITAYDATKDIVTIEFNGQAQLVSGNYVNITGGKVTAKIDRF